MFQEEIQLYEAIRQMRELNKQGVTFSMVHSTFNMDRVSTDGLRQVKAARLRTAATNEDVSYSDLKLFYFDEEIGKPRVCWQHLIMYFNDKKIVL